MKRCKLVHVPFAHPVFVGVESVTAVFCRAEFVEVENSSSAVKLEARI